MIKITRRLVKLSLDSLKNKDDVLRSVLLWEPVRTICPSCGGHGIHKAYYNEENKDPNPIHICIECSSAFHLQFRRQAD